MRATLFALVLAAAGCASAPISAAQESAAPQSAIEDCLARAADDARAQRECIGLSAAACMETPGGETTVGMIRCAAAEQSQWEAVRAATVANLRAIESPTQIALLDAALAEHTRWSEAHCAYAASIYEGGSLARVVGAMCMNEAVAEHALSLRNRAAEP